MLAERILSYFGVIPSSAFLVFMVFTPELFLEAFKGVLITNLHLFTLKTCT